MKILNIHPIFVANLLYSPRKICSEKKINKNKKRKIHSFFSNAEFMNKNKKKLEKILNKKVERKKFSEKKITKIVFCENYNWLFLEF